MSEHGAAQINPSHAIVTSNFPHLYSAQPWELNNAITSATFTP